MISAKIRRNGDGGYRRANGLPCDNLVLAVGRLQGIAPRRIAKATTPTDALVYVETASTHAPPAHVISRIGEDKAGGVHTNVAQVQGFQVCTKVRSVVGVAAAYFASISPARSGIMPSREGVAYVRAWRLLLRGRMNGGTARVFISAL